VEAAEREANARQVAEHALQLAKVITERNQAHLVLERIASDIEADKIRSVHTVLGIARKAIGAKP
jgi:hypothetical protein